MNVECYSKDQPSIPTLELGHGMLSASKLHFLVLQKQLFTCFEDSCSLGGLAMSNTRISQASASRHR